MRHDSQIMHSTRPEHWPPNPGPFFMPCRKLNLGKTKHVLSG